MSKALPIGRSLALNLVVALGLNMAWLVVVFWVVMLAAQAGLWPSTSEVLYVRLDGEPLLYRYRNVRTASVEMFTLDGQPAGSESQQLLYPSYMHPQKSSLVNPLLAQGWNSRMAAASDGRTPATYWYLVHDGRTNGRVYGVGYNALTKRSVGYFGRQGVSSELPPREDWFVVTGQEGLSQAVPVVATGEPVGQARPTIILLAEGKLWAFNTQSRTVETLFDAPRATTLGQAWVALDKLPPSQPGVMPQAAQYLTRQKLVVRSPDDFTIVDPHTGEQATFPLPSAFRKVAFATYELASGELLLISEAGKVEKLGHRLIWLAKDGTVTREKNVQLANLARTGNELALAGWFTALAGPHPLSHAFLALLIPVGMLEAGEVETYSPGFIRALGETWLSTLTVIAIGGLTAVVAYRRQRRFGLPHAVAWGAFVFILGIPGWIAYRFHRAWPVLEECPACHQPAPRDREACTECGADFPRPALKGIEVFA
jgi:hypothetical protein